MPKIYPRYALDMPKILSNLKNILSHWVFNMDTRDAVDTVYTVYNVCTVYNIQTAFHC